jgi:hypothetical protein
MLYNPENRNSLRVVVGLCALAISTGLELSMARAQDAAEDASTVTTGSAVATASAATTVSAPAAVPATEVTTLNPVDVHPSGKPEPTAGNLARPYYIEFRARAAYNYGHAFVVHGRVGQEPTRKDVVGLHPAGDSGPWMLGHIIPVPSETGWSDGDVGYNDKYITAKYRVFLTEAEYRIILSKMRQMQSGTKLWYAPLYNCVAFVGDIATFMGMNHPFHLVMPKEYINGIKEMNGGRQQLPSSWLQAMNPQAARQQALQLNAAPRQQAPQETAAARPQAQQHQQTAAARPQAQQQTAPANARKQHAAARPQTAEPATASYAGVR